MLQADVRDYDAIFAACEGADCVFHVASYGMSGREQVSPNSFVFGIGKRQQVTELLLKHGYLTYCCKMYNNWRYMFRSNMILFDSSRLACKKRVKIQT